MIDVSKTEIDTFTISMHTDFWDQVATSDEVKKYTQFTRGEVRNRFIALIHLLEQMENA
jgi:hypothetical protein